MKTSIHNWLWLCAASLFLSPSSCQKDPCSSVDCKNGGTCSDGTCECPEGFQGTDCSQQIQPSKVRIQKVSVTDFPLTSSTGKQWDENDLPDIFILITDDDGFVWESPVIFDNAAPSGQYLFEVTPAIEVTDFNKEYLIYLYDHDGTNPYEYMGGFSFKPYTPASGFPTQLNLETSKGELRFTLVLSYTW